MSLYGSNITGAILAGGRNSRFPHLKGFIKLDGIPIIERNLCLMRKFFDFVLISANNSAPYRYLGSVIVADVLPSRGPLSGIYSCLQYSPSPCVFVIACDMPFVSELLVERLCDYYMKHSQTAHLKAVVPVYKDNIQPLFGIYCNKAMQEMKQAVLADKVMMIKFLEEINTHYLEVGGIIDEGNVSTNSFVNVNTPRDFEALRLAGYDVSIDNLIFGNNNYM